MDMEYIELELEQDQETERLQAQELEIIELLDYHSKQFDEITSLLYVIVGVIVGVIVVQNFINKIFNAV